MEQFNAIDFTAINRNVGNWLLVAGMGWIVTGGFYLLGLSWVPLIYAAIFVLSLVGLLFHIHRYNGSFIKETGRRLIWPIPGLAAAFGVIAIVLLQLSPFVYPLLKEPKIDMLDNGFIVNCAYGTVLHWDEVISAELVDGVPKGSMVKGDELFCFCKGKFNIPGWGVSRVYIRRGVSPYIRLSTKEGYFLLSLYAPEKTLEIYQTIRENLSAMSK
jgi:hypothetical protein